MEAPSCSKNFRWALWFPQKEPKWLLADTFSYLKIYQNASPAEAAPRRTHLGGEEKGKIRERRE